MNALERWVKEAEASELEIMDTLQDEGVVSDEALWACNVSDADAERAVKWLEETR